MEYAKFDIARFEDYYNQPRGKVLIGIDGFVDEVWQVVETRENAEKYTLRENMRSFGQLILDCGEGGVSNEIIFKRRSYGGCCGNTGRACGSMGANVTLLGMFGEGKIEEPFAPVLEVAEMVSIGSPALCSVYEFLDGKVMLPYIQNLLGFNWDALLAALPECRLNEMYGGADIVALGYWSLMPAFDEILRGICENFMRKNDSEFIKKQRMFFDPADIRKRDKEALKTSLALMASLSKRHDIDMTISLNEHEADLLFSYYDEKFDESDPEASVQSLGLLREKLCIDEAVVHTPRFAIAATSTEGTALVSQRYCEKPVITTGAGDNFNGGYMAASLGNLTIHERLLASNAATAFYVKNGHPAKTADLLNEIALYI